MEISQDMVELVLARTDAMPDNIQVCLDGLGVFGKEDIKKHVRDQDDLGRMIVENQIQYLRRMIRGWEDA
mgnify:CR=1 FL=1